MIYEPLEAVVPITPHCAELASPSYFNFILSILLLLGILISYLPQHHRILSRRTSEGLSPWFVLLGTTSGTCAFANILMLPASRADVACCKEIGSFACLAGLLGIFQVGMQWSCFAVILLLFLIFFPRDDSSSTNQTTNPSQQPSTPTAPKPDSPSYRTAVFVALLCVAHAFLTLFISTLFLLSFPTHLQSWANILGILSTILASIQYFPQIWTTYRLRRAGSLSIPMMCIQTPGSFVWAGSLAARLGGKGWSAWGVYVVTGCLQGVLLVMAILFEISAKKGKRGEQEQVAGADAGVGITNGVVAESVERAAREGDATEQTPLLSG